MGECICPQKDLSVVFTACIQLLERQSFQVWKSMHQREHVKKNIYSDKYSWKLLCHFKKERTIQKLAQSHPVN